MNAASSFLLPLPRFRGVSSSACRILPYPYPYSSSVCAQCRRAGFSSVAARYSGHNRWSKIRHEKGAADQKKTAQRSVFAKHLTLYSKLYGPDPNMNSQLAGVISAAKKAGMPKANIDVAIARGQGKSLTGQGLESVTLEVMIPSPTATAAMVIDIESDNKQRTLQDLRVVIKKHGGNVTPTAFLFTRLGRSVLGAKANPKSIGGGGEEKEGNRIAFDDVFMQAVDMGAEDVEQDGQGNVVVWTQPSATHQVAQKLASSLDMEILSSDIIYSPSAEKARVDDAEMAAGLGAFLSAVRDYPEVQAVYANLERGDVAEDLWKSIEEDLDS